MAGRIGQLAGTRVRSRSTPRFDASAFDDAVLAGTEAHGKHLLVHFADRAESVHLHLGMVGRVSVRRLRNRALGADGFPRTDPPAPAALRWRMLTADFVADIVAPTICEVLAPDDVERLHDRLGPDPLRADADPQRFVTKVESSQRPIGRLLLDQSVIAGVGNVYRAELLFRLRIDPYRHGCDLTAVELDALWSEATALLDLGRRAGWIITSPSQIEAALAVLDRDERVPRWPKRYFVYRRQDQPCRVCGAPIAAADMGQQRIFWCPRCQA